MLTLITLPDPRLTTPSQPVASFDRSLLELASEMNEIMISSNGIGLAAPQVGSNLRLVITKIRDEGRDYQAFVNPTITFYSKKELAVEEGCLSIPGVYGYVSRATKVRVAYRDLEGKKHTQKFIGMEAVKIQHEVDHLNGTLIIDRPITITKGALIVERFRHGDRSA